MSEPLCRPGCSACCVAPSISSPIPGMPEGKARDLPCVQLSDRGLCLLFGRPERPAVCASLKPSLEMCGSSREEALGFLAEMEDATAPIASLVRGVGDAKAAPGSARGP